MGKEIKHFTLNSLQKNVVDNHDNLRCSGTTHPRLWNNLPHVRGKLSHLKKKFAATNFKL